MLDVPTASGACAAPGTVMYRRQFANPQGQQPPYYYCLLASNISSGASASLQYLRRHYLLFNVMEPAGLFTYLIRKLLCEQFRGRSLSGTLFRTNDYGRCIILCAIGLPEEHERLMSEVLEMRNAEGELYCEYTRQCQPEEWVRDMPTTQFTLAQSSKGAIRGGNSNLKYDHPTEKTKSQKYPEQR